ncbi:MAG TPA: hypothetical protein VIE63_01280 [Ramlibacter sp.]|jgi:hypothetical protein
MEPDNDGEDRLAPPTRGETLVPAMAVVAVAVVAVAAAVMARHSDPAPAPQFSQRAAAPVANVAVVQAPPLNAPATSSMGGAAACRECGVVEMVVGVYDRGSKEPHAYQMHVRMDDGTIRTVEQRGALAAGSRVVVDGSTVRPMS